MGFLKFIRKLRIGIGFLALFSGFALFTIVFGLIAVLHVLIEIVYRLQYGVDWKHQYEVNFGIGSLAEDQRLALIGGFASLAIILLAVWCYKQTFPNKSNGSNHRRRKRKS